MPVSKNRVNPPAPANTGNTGRRYGGVDSDERQRQRKQKLVDAIKQTLATPLVNGQPKQEVTDVLYTAFILR